MRMRSMRSGCGVHQSPAVWQTHPHLYARGRFRISNVFVLQKECKVHCVQLFVSLVKVTNCMLCILRHDLASGANRHKALLYRFTIHKCHSWRHYKYYQ